MRNLISAAALLSIAAPALAQEAGGFSQPYWIDKPVIEALGRADLQVKPNRTSFSVTYKNTADTAAAATRQASERAKAAHEAMTGVAGEDLTVTSNVTVNPVYNQVRDDEGNLTTDYSADNIRAYEVAVTLNVGVEDISKASRTRAAALALGPEGSSYFNNSLERDTEILQAAYRAAITDARQRAQMIAQAAGVSLGKLLVVQEGSGPCLGEWTDGTGYSGYSMAPPPPPPPPPPPAPSGPGAMTVSQEDMDALDLPNTPDTMSVRGAACLVYEIRQ